MYNTAVLMFHVHMGLAPQYVRDLLHRAPARYGSNNYMSYLALVLTYKRRVLHSLGDRFGNLSLRR